jgi:hypothetical protein
MILLAVGGRPFTHEECRHRFEKALAIAVGHCRRERDEVRTRALPHPIYPSGDDHLCSNSDGVMPREGLINVNQYTREWPHPPIVEKMRRHHKQQRTCIARRGVVLPSVGKVTGCAHVLGDLLCRDAHRIGTVRRADYFIETHDLQSVTLVPPR